MAPVGHHAPLAVVTRPAPEVRGAAAPPADRRGERRWVAVAGAATLLLAGLALWGLGSKSLSYDESVTVALAHLPFLDTVELVVRYEANQAPYYLLFSAWYEVGQSEGVMRLLSVAFAVATPPVLFVLGRRLASARVGAVAALLLALNSLAITWAKELRSYSLAMLLVTVMSYLLVRAVEDPAQRRWPVAYAAVAGLAVYAHFFVALVVVAHGLSLLLLRPRPRLVGLRAGVVLAVAALPVAAYLATRRRDPLNYIEVPSPSELVAIAADVAGGSRLQLLVIGAAAAAGVATAWAAVRRRPGTRATWGLVMPALWLVVPLGALLVSTYTVKPLLLPRYLVIVVPALALVVAAAIDRLAARSRAGAGALAAATVLVAALGAVNFVRAPARTEWRAATAYVLDRAAPDDALVAVPGQVGGAVEYYERRLGGTLPVLEPSADDPPGGATLWEIVRELETPLVWDPMPTYPEWRDRWYVQVDERRISDQVVVRRYDRRP